jgi:hypothetical protein
MVMLQMFASVLGGVLIAVALFVLWSKTQSGWLLLALASEGISVLFRIALALVPTLLSTTPMIPMVWSVTGLLMAAGLLGYAFDAPKRPG